MPTFLDESGDVGVKLGARAFFRITAVWFPNEGAVTEYVDAINQLREKTLRISPTFEFHFAKISESMRHSFFLAVADLPFRFAHGSIQKPALPTPPDWTKETVRAGTIDHLLGKLGPWYLATEAAKATPGGLNERVSYDNCTDPEYDKALKRGFRAWRSQRGPNEKLVKSVLPVHSQDTRIQIADMVGGAINRFLDENDRDLYKFLAGKEI